MSDDSVNKGPTPEEVARRVDAGIAWLDANRSGWRGEVSSDKLKMSNSCSCVLGQLYGTFGNAPLSNDRQFAEYGFDAEQSEFLLEWYHLLQAEWKYRLTGRRA